ncbi:ABC transporter permease [Chitinophagaceae bacterium LWZ2-11]
MSERKNIPGFWRLFFREASIIAKDHSLLLTLLIAPLLYAFFYGSIYMYKEEEGVKLAIVDDDNSNLSRLLTQQISNAQITSTFKTASLNTAQEEMYKGNCQGFFYIEKGLEQKVLTLHQADVVLTVNAARFLPSSDLLMGLNQICLTVSAGVRLQYLQKSEGQSSQISMQEVMPVNLNYKPLFNERSSYGAFLLPGLLALILQQTLLIGLSASVASERNKKKVNEWMQTAGNNLSVALWGKGFFYLILFGAYAFFFLNVNFNILQLPMRGSKIDLAFALFLFIATLIPMGQCLGSLFKQTLLNVQIMAFSTYPIFLITGYTWPLKSLPVALQWISALLPTTPFLKVYQSIVQAGGTLSQNKGALIHLLILLIFYSLLCFVRFRKIRKVEEL